MTTERIVRANGVDLCAQTFGVPGHPAVLLIAGSAASMLAWEDGFCERLAAGARFVIRYDHRDTGRSVSYSSGAPGYTLRDLVADAEGLLDTFGLASAHVVGISLGGMIGQLLALDAPDRVASLTLISTSPGGAGPHNPDLPPTPLDVRVELHGTPWPDWSDRAAVIEYVVALERPVAGRSRPFDEAARRDLAGRVFDRTADMAASMTNHLYVDDGGPWRQRLGEIGVPTLVVHGAEDPVFPQAHAVALAKEIPGAELVVRQDAGHELTRADWDVVVPAIDGHISRT